MRYSSGESSWKLWEVWNWNVPALLLGVGTYRLFRDTEML